MSRKQKIRLEKIIIAAVLLIVLHFIPVEGWLRFVLYLIPYFVVGYDSVKKAVTGIFKGRVLDENFLMTVATVGAFALGVLTKSGDYVEGVTVMLFYQIGEFFESYAVGKSRKDISDLMDIRPDTANLLTDEADPDGYKTVSPDEVSVGSTIVVLPGEKIPIDGIVTKGETTIDTRALTGEAKPRSVHPDDEVLSGSINGNGVINIRTTKEFGQSTASKVLELVENASSRKSRSENFISKFARYYTPAVCILAIAVAVIPPVVNICFGKSSDVMTFIYRALTFLVISCPCALVISIPLSFFAGIGAASSKGILIKGSNFLESLSQIDTVIFDKTGTLTKGVFEVVSIHKKEMSDEKLLRFAAYAESFSTHPISRSIINAFGKEIDKSLVDNVNEISGHGVEAVVEGCRVLCGNDKLLRDNGIEPAICHDGGTIVHIAIDGKYAGHIHISDVIKETSKQAIADLRAYGMKRSVMLTGDAEEVAEKVAAELMLDEYHAQLLPQDKVETVEKIIGDVDGRGKTVFVGDGINDAPVLTRADVGIAMGALGSDAAIEAADVVLMDDDPAGIVRAVKISRKCMKIVYENIWFAIGIKVLCLILSAFGITNMWLAIFADVGVMILAVLNSLRTMRVKSV